MTIAIEVSVDIRAAQAALAKVNSGFVNRAYLKLIGERFLAWINENFRKAGAEQSWKPLSPNTVAARRKGKGAGSAQPLRDTGRMAQSFVARIGADQVWVGTEDRKAVFHQFGTRSYVIRPKQAKALRFATAGKGVIYRRVVRHPGIQARPLLPSPQLAERLAQEVLRAYVDELARSAG